MAPPAPPTGPPPPPSPPVPSAHVSTEDAAGALFAEISALGEKGIRGNLKKATKGPVNEKAPASPMRAPVVPKKTTDLGGKPKCTLFGKKWSIEFQNGANGGSAISINTDLKQTVYIFKCHDTLVKISGKVNAIVMDTCSKSACVFDEALASVELVNSKDIQIQCTKTAPAISIDGCTAVTYYMSPSYQEAQIITAKSTAINLIRPSDDDDIVETPVPEQFCTTWKNGTWVTECVDHSD